MGAVISGLTSGAIYALVALGLSVAFSVMRLSNFAHGDLVTLSMYLMLTMITALALSPLVAAPIVIALMAVAGVAVYRGIFAPTFRVRDRSLPQLFATVGLSIVTQNGILLGFGAGTRGLLSSPFKGGIDLGIVVVPWSRVFVLGLLIAVGLAMWYLLSKMKFGLKVRAVAEDRYNAQLTGIDLDRVYRQVTAISFALAAVAGVGLLPIFILYPDLGINFLLIAFMAVVIGGLGSVVGAVIGGMLLGVIESISATYVSPLWAPGFMYLTFLVILLARPHGLFGDPDWKLE